MVKFRMQFSLAFHIVLCLLAFVGELVSAQSTPFLGRGVNVEGNIKEQVLADFAATGGNLVRLQGAFAPLRDMTPPYSINQHSFLMLERQLDWCKKYKLNCVIDPHKIPGLGAPRRPYDPMWSDKRYGDMAVELWSEIAAQCASRGDEVAGYDLMNEPALPLDARKGSPSDWNALVARIIAAIRAKDKTRPIIIEAPVEMQLGHGIIVTRASAFRSYFPAPPDPNVIYSLHFYEPQAFTFTPDGWNYPGVIKGKQWNASTIAQYFAPVAAFQNRYHVQIYLGEFGCARWGGDACNRWIKDVIDYAEAHHWSWTYHSWRGADMWDAEKNNYDKNDHQRYPTTPRLKILENAWRQGRR